MRLVTRSIEAPEALELYVSVTPELGTEAEAREMFAAVREAVEKEGARTVRERVFVPEGKLDAYQRARSEAYKGREEEIAADWLWAGTHLPYGGIQVHAVAGPVDWQPLHRGKDFAGWTFRQNGCRWAYTGGLTAPQGGDGPRQTKDLFDDGEKILADVGMDLTKVARTWIYLDHILNWYTPFNKVRNDLFIERGILKRGNGDCPRVPASTGMGVTPAFGGRIAMEFFAVDGPAADIKRYSGAGKQRSAYEYGSAFARASSARTPAGRSVFVSGTAAIDAEGNTCHIGDAHNQIKMTIDCVLAVLRDAEADPDNVVQAMAYCKTLEVADEFRRKFADNCPWPWVIVIGDVCRDDLLFEVEVTACETIADPASVAVTN